MTYPSPAVAAWLAATLLAYLGARALQRRLGGHPLANTVLLPAAVLLGLLALTRTPGETYQRAGAPLLFLLGPGTVALAVPLRIHAARVRSAALPLAVALVAGSFTAVVTAVGIAWALGAEPETLRSLAPKSVTTPIAMGIARAIGGAPPLTAVFVIATGAVGALSGSSLFDRLRVRDPRARGLAMGVAAHGMGTARAFQVDVVTGIFSSVGMTLNGIVTAALLPVLWDLLARVR